MPRVKIVGLGTLSMSDEKGENKKTYQMGEVADLSDEVIARLRPGDVVPVDDHEPRTVPPSHLPHRPRE